MVGALAALGSAGVGRDPFVTWPGPIAALGVRVCERQRRSMQLGLDTALAAGDARACRGKSRPGRCSSHRKCLLNKTVCHIGGPGSGDSNGDHHLPGVS